MLKNRWVTMSWVASALAIAVLLGAIGAVEAETLKIGAVMDFSFPLHVQYKKQLGAVVQDYNKKGGLDIQGKKYDIDLIIYDDKMNAETARSAVERLIHKDQVKFIMGDEVSEAWIPLTEANKILVTVAGSSPKMRAPNLKYVFQSTSLNTQSAVAWAWFTKTYPEKKKISAIFTDDVKGRTEANNLKRLCAVFGQKITDIIFYPPDTTDFSAIATRLKNGNPDVFTTCAGGPVQDALSFKAMKESGWGGQIFSYVSLNPASIGRIISLDFVEGMLGCVSGVDLPTPPSFSQEFKNVYIAKYGKYDNPSIVHFNNWYLLTQALEQAQSLDPDNVAAHIAKGMKFVSPQNKAMTVSRPDLKNSRCVDSLFEVNVGRIRKGVSEKVANIPLEEGFKSLNVFMSAKK